MSQCPVIVYLPRRRDHPCANLFFLGCEASARSWHKGQTKYIWAQPSG